VTAAPRPGHPLLQEASAARKAGEIQRAERVVRQLLASEPAYAPAWNLLGLIQSDDGCSIDAVASFSKSAQLDQGSPEILFNLSRVHQATGDYERELVVLGQALSRDPYFLPAILAKGRVLRQMARDHEAFQLYRLLFDGLRDDSKLPLPLRQQLAEARAFVENHGARRLAEWKGIFEEARRDEPMADLSRAEVYAQHRAGLRRVYNPQPINNHFPFLPAFEFFPRQHFPWFSQLEEGTAVIRDELISLWSEESAEFRPYIQMQSGEPVAQWQELNHSPKWTSYFLWEDGERDERHIARCPKTAAILDALPMLDMPSKAPTAMFSILQPKTRIPPHTGSSNTRLTVHLPLIVPSGCGFRVGGETREWVEGVAWAFDDTIEHEAWNDSDHPRAILIIDAWNPLLSEAERAIIRAIG
jgi:aspartyl/asparaginyl beta-hydroxylase (cupin superfamily)